MGNIIIIIKSVSKIQTTEKQVSMRKDHDVDEENDKERIETKNNKNKYLNLQNIKIQV